MTRECDIINGKVRCEISKDKIYTANDVKSRKRVSNNSEYSISRGRGAYENAKNAVDQLGGMCKFVKKGDLVAVKANMTGGTPTMPQTFTNFEVLDSVIDQVRDCGGTPFVYDSSMIWTEMEPIAEKAGFYKWGTKKEVPIINLTRENRIKFDFGEDFGMDDASQLIKESDILIDVPVAKNHIMTGITVALKNMYGTLPERDKAKYHAKGINETIGVVNRNFRPNLTVVDMIEGCEGGGPLSCRAIDPKPDTVIASNDPVCADTVASEIMGYSKQELGNIQHLEVAEKMGVGSRKCADDIDQRLDVKNPKDYKWAIVPDKGGLAGVVTDMVAKSMEWAPMIPVMDVISDFGLGWTAYTFKYGMSDIWDFVLYTADRFNQRVAVDKVE